MKPEYFHISHAVSPDGRPIYHLWHHQDGANAAMFGITPMPIASNQDRAVLEKAIEHLCAEP